jgi:hypothetical protein
VVRQIFWLSVTRNFHYGIFFIIVHYPTHSVLTFCLPKKLLFVYLQLPKYPFCLPILNFLYYLCIVLKVLFVYPIKNTFYLQPRIMCICFCQLQELFVYHFKTTFYVPPRITCCLFLLTTYTYSPFQHITASFL